MTRLHSTFAGLALLFSLVMPGQADAADFIKELKNATKRGARDKADTTFVLHHSNGEETSLSGSDYETFTLRWMERGDGSFSDEYPMFLELYKGSGEKKHNIMINIASATYYKLDIEEIDGRWRYDFHFYY